MSFEGVLNQIFQPYFYYSVIFLVISFICVKMSVKYCSFLNRNVRSVISLVPLMIPLFVMLVFMPSTIIQTGSVLPHRPPGFAEWQHNFPYAFAVPHLPPLRFIVPPPFFVTDTLSVTGIICLVGLAIGFFFASAMILAGGKLARKVLHVISLAPDEYPWLQAKINELSKKLAIRTPKVGLTEDLRPNAFTIGYGRKTTIAFSIGLLNVLDKDEVIAVASHELAHVKSHDFFYKTLSSALTAISFFNPLAYFASSSAQREREMLADERATKVLKKPVVLGNALAKICGVLQTLPKEGMWVRMTSNLLITSSILHRPQILAAHPGVGQRLKNISEAPSSRRSGYKVSVAVLLSLLIIIGGVVASIGMVSLQVGFISSETPRMPDFGAVNNRVFDNRSAWLNHMPYGWEMNASQGGSGFVVSSSPMFFGRSFVLSESYHVSSLRGSMPGVFWSPSVDGIVSVDALNGTNLFHYG